MSLEKIREISHKIADPYIKSSEAWRFASYILALLLILSVCANIYLVTKSGDITVEQDYKQSNYNENNVG